MNLAYKHDSPQGEVIEFPKQERQVMSQKAEGFTPMPNFLVDERYIAELPAEAVKLLVILNRHIVGYQESEKAFSTSLAMELAGIKDERTATKYLKVLADWNLVIPKKARGKATVYSLNFTTPKDTNFKKLPTSNEGGLPTQHVPTFSGNFQQPPTQHAGTPPTHHEGGVPTCHGGLINKLNKETFKENTCTENPVDAVLKLWTPNLDALNAWLQRSGIAKMTQSEVDGWLLEINGYYSTKLEAGLLTDTQMYTNFVKWIKRNFSSRKPAPKVQEQIDSRNVNAAWENINPDYSNAGEPVELEDWML
ncbi:replication protein [Acinetobacter baumannii]|uniref:replication protein n=1 Tax=Acinetobacter baumannii TaxID=470 RepID=UPI003AF7C7C2